MGLLSEGNPLSWEETKQLADHVRKHGIEQFINIYHRLKNRGDAFKWGDEMEYIIVKFDDENKVARVSLRAQELLEELNKKEAADPTGIKCRWRPEYAAYMIEGTPGKPFCGLMAHFSMIETNMELRQQELKEHLQPGECVLSVTNFPRLGRPEFTYPIYHPRPDDPNGVAKSLYFPDEAIYPGHPRFKTLTRNIRMRRGEKVTIKLKVFKDEKTVLPVEGSPPDEPDVVLLDAMGFGMGCCCLQMTFQASNITEACTLYDQLAPLCPIMLALTAASPIYRGYLTESDCRWNVISSSVDCRTAEERGLQKLMNNKFRIFKSRYDSIDSYLSSDGEKYNDVPLVYDEAIYQRLRDGGIEHLIAQHIAHLFIRDTVSLFSEKINQNDEEDTDHFENIQSTNWQTMRFKPPPPNSSIGWRVEFRPCEAQITTFENAAFVCFIVLLTRVILSYKLNFLIPISRVDENMQTAQKRDACRKEKFWFSKMNQKTCTEATNGVEGRSHCTNEYELMTIDEIFNGKNGLISLIKKYLKSVDVDDYTYSKIEQYLNLIQKRASGEFLTTATWMREEVINHPDYKRDSVVSDRINYDLLRKMHQIQEGLLSEPKLFEKDNHSKVNEFISSGFNQKQCNGGLHDGSVDA